LFDGSSHAAVMNMNLLTATDSTEKSNTAENWNEPDQMAVWV